MLLYPDLSHSVTIDGIEYEVNTKYFIVLKILELSKKDLKETIKAKLFLDLFYKDGFGDNPLLALEAMWAWIQDGNLKINSIDEEESEPVLDYLKDDQFIFASMCQTYGEVWKNWHWYEWKAAFDNLPDNTPIKQIMSIRGQKIKSSESAEEKIRIRKLKKIYSLGEENKNRTGDEILAELQERKRKLWQTEK